MIHERLANVINKVAEGTQVHDIFHFGSILERTYYRNDSKRPAISEPKQIVDVTSCLLSGILCKQYAYLFTKK